MAIADVSDKSIADLISLRGQVAVVTGGGRGTGLGIVGRLVEAGAAVVIGEGDEEAARHAAQAVDPTGDKVFGMKLDVDDEVSVTGLAERVVSELGTIDLWINNAGIYPGAPVLDMTSTQWDQVVDFNLKGVFLGAREAARRMISAGHGGVIVNIASTASFRAFGSGNAHYVSSKFGVRGLTKALAVELGQYGIRVLGVAPTFIETPGTRERRADLTDSEYREFIQRAGATKALGRVGVPDDVARVVLFCASGLSAFMTGSTLAVDAGDLAR
jgi:NAD(P)-dependent dehydrogenase (short-subunit alcohol dehydrogenase family)